MTVAKKMSELRLENESKALEGISDGEALRQGKAEIEREEQTEECPDQAQPTDFSRKEETADRHQGQERGVADPPAGIHAEEESRKKRPEGGGVEQVLPPQRKNVFGCDCRGAREGQAGRAPRVGQSRHGTHDERQDQRRDEG